MCFIDLQKASDSDRVLLWEAFARFGLPENMIEIIRQFHDGMHACARLDDVECSKRFNAEHGLFPSVRARAPNVFFAAVLGVVRQRCGGARRSSQT